MDSKNRLAGWTCCIGAMVWGTSSHAQETGPSLHLLTGEPAGIGGGNIALDQRSAAYELIYEQPQVLGNAGVDFRYLNEGYLGQHYIALTTPLAMPVHYRDAFSVLLDHWSPQFAHCRIGAAAGPETYFDTTAKHLKYEYEDRHGFGLQTSLAGQCRLFWSLAIEVIATRSFEIASYDSTAFVLGLVYTPDLAAAQSGGGSWDSSRRQYIELSGGQLTIDSLRARNEKGTPVWGTYGVALQGPLAVEFSLLNENASEVFRRHGVAIQLALHHEFAGGRLEFFGAAGPELARTDEIPGRLFLDEDDARFTQVNFLLSYGVRVPIGRRFSLLLKLGRVSSASGRDDTDLLTVGFALNSRPARD